MRITPLIVCGGSGTRLWPASRQDRPKQFLPLFGPLSSFQQTLLRVNDRGLFDQPVVIANREHRFLIVRQLREIGIEADQILEPEPRDSGPAIAAGAAFVSANRGAEVPVLSLAADHAIRDVAAFRSDCRLAAEGAGAGAIVTFGITPDHPATGYGYVAPGAVLTGPVRRVERFVEKPDRETAERYVRAGFLWNSGNFLFEARTLLDEYRACEPQTIRAIETAIGDGVNESGALMLDPAAFSRAGKRSIDYAVMERTARAAVLRASFDWSDVGSWDAVGELLPQDDAGNAVQGRGALLRARNNVVVSSGPTVALVGLDELAVIATPDAILVAPRGDAAAVKQLVEHIRGLDGGLMRHNSQTVHPWGSAASLEEGDAHQVRRLLIDPGVAMGPQEGDGARHWTLVRGTGTVTIDGQQKILGRGDTLSIAAGRTYAVENAGPEALEIVEIRIRSAARARQRREEAMKQVACGDVVPGCDFVARAETEAELLRKVAEHARQVHGMQEITPELIERVKSRITEK